VVEGLLVERSDDLHWAPLDTLHAELDRTTTHWSEVVHENAPARHFALRNRFVMLSPYRVGPVGTRALGAAVVERMRAAGSGDLPVTPIMIEENSHELGLFNGDFAMLIDGSPRMACVQRDSDELPNVAEARLPRYSDAFALTVHKSQGSEFDEVLVLFPQEDAPLLTRELLYTAVSRAKKRVRLVGPKEVVMAALARKAERYSGLVDAIVEAEHVPLRNGG
jgi:exodeoxyribonuclease V alpha subunit